ncbi:hypothetical protein YA0002_24560 [Pseudomonas cichorii]|uniref:hypothetical protein n=1 Tax=Pseudomonas cichorii TaxID=36746 RepID=UPI0018E62D8B|nr:hypothetical protein [Pseudomonas cichorii]MBI6855941.1 hypothetical protein [Pseudomonas cichorii]
MSQHIVCLHCEKSSGIARVQLGWDKPCSEFYLVVFEEPPFGVYYEEDRIVYSSLDDPNSRARELDYFKTIAINLGCKVPDSMWRAAYQDREFNVVNKTVFYSLQGDLVEPF